MWTDGITELEEKVEELEEENDKLKSSIKKANAYFADGNFTVGLAIILKLVEEFDLYKED